MPRATLAVDLPEETWIHAISSDHPEAVVRVLSVLPDGDIGTGLAELRTDEPVAVLAAIDDHSDIESIELLQQFDDRALVQFETASPFLLGHLAGVGVPLETPFVIRDGTVELSLTTSNERLSSLGNRLDAADIAYETRAVHPEPGRGADRLTDRQREMLLAAVEAGYYETPRAASLTEVAGSMGIAKATGSDLLHRAESTLVDWYLEEHPARAEALA